jgi:hypothetical protein
LRHSRNLDKQNRFLDAAKASAFFALQAIATKYFANHKTIFRPLESA